MTGAIPSSYPTTSDISCFMGELGFKWSNDAQVYYHESMIKYEHLTRQTAERLYKYLIGDKPYSPLRKGDSIIMTMDEAEHLLACMANQKFIGDVNADGISEGADSVRETQKENQAVIDEAYRKLEKKIHAK